MTRDEIVVLARDSGFETELCNSIDGEEVVVGYIIITDFLVEFANLVVEKYKNDIFGLTGVDDWIEAKPILFPTTESLIAEAVAKEREACAQLCEPKSKRPCDCESCYCQNSGDLADVTSWDDATRLAKAIRARGRE